MRWFATDAALGTTAVNFGGAALGKLALTPNSGASLNKTVTVNSVTQGAAALPTTPIVTAATKTDSTTSLAVNFPIAYTIAMINGLDEPVMHPLDVYVALPLGVVAGTYAFSLSLNPHSGGSGYYSQSFFAIGDVVQAVFTGTPPATLAFSVPLSANQATLRVSHFVSSRGLLYPLSAIYPVTNPTIAMVAGSVITRPTQNVISVSAASNPVAAASLANAGIAVTLANNAIQITVPAPPRVVNTVFELPTYTRWSDFANKTAEISLTGTGASLAIVETYLQIEFDEIAYAAAEDLTATVTGLDGNPAAVIAVLAAASDEPVDLAAKTRLSAWCAANGLAFARRLAEPDDALTLLQYAADQAGVFLARPAEALAPVRWLDLAGQITAITDADLIEPARIGWADRVENAITLRYADDYAAGAGFTRVAQATAANTADCSESAARLNETRAVELDGGWLRADTAAAAALTQHVGRHARPRRVAALDLPFAFSLEHGGLIEYAEAVWRITAIADDAGWLAVDAEEVLS